MTLDEKLAIVTKSGEPLPIPTKDELLKSYTLRAIVTADPVNVIDPDSNLGRVIELKASSELPHNRVRIGGKVVNLGYYAIGWREGKYDVFYVYGPSILNNGNANSRVFSQVVGGLMFFLAKDRYNIIGEKYIENPSSPVNPA